MCCKKSSDRITTVADRFFSFSSNQNFPSILQLHFADTTHCSLNGPYATSPFLRPIPHSLFFFLKLFDENKCLVWKSGILLLAFHFFFCLKVTSTNLYPRWFSHLIWLTSVVSITHTCFFYYYLLPATLFFAEDYLNVGWLSCDMKFCNDLFRWSGGLVGHHH